MRRGRRRGDHVHPNHERWLVSYADFITLLFAFFVVMYASSRADQTKAHIMAHAIQSAFSSLGLFTPAATQINLSEAGPPLPSPEAAGPDAAVLADRQSLAALQTRLQHELGPEIKEHAISLQLSHQGLLIRLQQLGFFASGSADLTPTSRPILQTIGASVASLPNPVRIEGHTDNIPIHNAQFASNWDLSTARASRLVQLLIDQNHVTPSRLSAAGYADYHPVASNATAAGRALNRRVDIVVVSLEAARATEPSAGAHRLSVLPGAPPAVP